MRIIAGKHRSRILKTLEVCKEVFGEQSQIVLARELTKKFEEFFLTDFVYKN